MSGTLEDKSIWEDGEETLGEEVLRMPTDEIVSRTRLMDNEIKIMKSEVMRITHELQTQNEKIKDNAEKIKVNKTLPYLVSNVIELLDVDPQEEEDDGAVLVLDNQRKGKCAVIKTSTRQTYFLPVIGLVDPEKLKPGDLVGVNKDSYLILETLPAEYDARVKVSFNFKALCLCHSKIQQQKSFCFQLFRQWKWTNVQPNNIPISVA